MVAPLDDVARLKDILDYRTAVAFLALLTFAVAFLFVLLIRAKDKQLQLALQVMEHGKRMQAALEELTRIVEQVAARRRPRAAPAAPPTEAA